jgi:serine/threonine protein kinase/nucleotide-binding universal stress UspA family protein
MTSVAVAINGDAAAATAGQGSRRAFRWALDNLLPAADRFVLVHVIPTVTSIPTPSGDQIPIEQLDARAVAMYVQDIKAKSEEILTPFKKLCKTRKMETLVLEGENPASELLRYISEKRITSLVLGSRSLNCIARRMLSPTVPSLVLEQAPENCDIYVVHRDRLITTSLTYPSPTAESSCRCCFFTSPECGSRRVIKQRSGSITDHTYLISKSSASHENSNVYSNDFDEFNRQDSSGAEPRQSDVQDEVEKLRVELQNNISMYRRACEDLVHAQNKLQVLSSHCLEESEKVNNALKREEEYRKIAAEEKEKRLEAIKEIEEAKTELAKESYMRQIAELNAEKESLEKQKIVEKLFANDKRCRRYNKEEIEKATDNFSDSKKVGEGAYGKVYKCNLDHTPVAVKVLRSDSTEKKEEFLKEVEVLSQLRHPNIVLLLGACPESGCLVYEYMENGSLDNHIYNTATKPLPWPVRFRILFQIACGLVFLHNSKPEPIIHRDIKPGNILLDRNFISKIGDVGLAKLITDVVPDDVTEYRDSILAGTLLYMDPEYQRTGTIRPKSDLYAFGIIILQMLSGRHPNGLLVKFENGIGSSSFSDLLDKSVSDWPLAEAEELAELSLDCSKLRCRDRPDLETQVLPVLKKLADFAERYMKIEKSNDNAPSHFYCPITQEIMENPHIAPDGFSYEHRAIKLWVDRHNVSPVTKLRLKNKVLTPNHTLHSAIQEWKSHPIP